MKLACKFVINNMGGDIIAVPVGKESPLKGYIRVNDSGKEIIELLYRDTDREKIIAELKKRYPDAKKEDIIESVDDVIKKLSSAGLII